MKESGTIEPTIVGKTEDGYFTVVQYEEGGKKHAVANAALYRDLILKCANGENEGLLESLTRTLENCAFAERHIIHMGFGNDSLSILDLVKLAVHD